MSRSNAFRRHVVLGGALCLSLLVAAGCSDPQSPPATDGDANFTGLYQAGGAMEFRIDTASGDPSPLRLVASDLSFDAATGQVHAQVAILNTGAQTLPGPAAVQIGEIDPDWVVPLNASPLRCPDALRCLGTWEFLHEGTYGGDGLLSPGETSAPVEWVFADSTGESFSFRASLRPGDATRPGVISGFVFADANGDGKRQVTEPGIGGVGVTLVHGDSATTTTTDEFGVFEFQVEEAGLYQVVRDSDPTCDPTTPVRYQVFVILRPDGTLSGYSGVAFGCRSAVPGDGIVISGIVFEDLNRDGSHQPGEPGLAGVLVTAVVPACPTFAPIEMRTDNMGRYSLRAPFCPPPVFVSHEALPGFVDTSPNPLVLPGDLPVPAEPGTPPGPGTPGTPTPPGDPFVLLLRADFGVARADSSGESSVEGYVFTDTNRNGVRDSNEPGLAGVEVTASGILCMTPVLGVTHTDATGHYFLNQTDVHCPLPWRVTHAEVGGMCDTSTNPVEVGWDRMADPRHYRVDFGVASCDSVPNEGTLVVWVFWDGQGLPGRRLVVVERNEVQFTNERGVAQFRLPPGEYTLHADVNGPGPPLGQDFKVTVRRGQITRLDVLDCLPCVSIE